MPKKLDFDFLAIDKSLFSKGLNPTEILVYAQIAEYNRNTGDCFISDKAMAEMFGVSDKTISRALTALESKGMIRRETKNVKGGKERHIYLTKDNLSVVNEKTEETQRTNCLLSKDKLSVVNGQNDLIKENIKEKEKDNLTDVSAKAETSVQNEPEVKVSYPKYSRSEVDAMGCKYEELGDNLVKILATGKIIELT